MNDEILNKHLYLYNFNHPRRLVPKSSRLHSSARPTRVRDERVVRVRVARERSLRGVLDRNASRASIARDETVDACRGGER